MPLIRSTLYHWDSVLLVGILAIFGSEIVATCEPLATYIVQESGDPFGWLEPILTNAPIIDPHVETLWI